MLGDNRVKVESTTEKEESKPLIERIPDNFKKETIYLSKWIKPKPLKELFKPLHPNEMTLRNLALQMTSYLIYDTVVNPEPPVDVFENELNQIDAEEVGNARVVESEVRAL